MWLCDAFNIPLVFLMDCPGFLVGTKVEKEGIIRHGAKMLFAVSEATVPKITVVLRKGYGAGYFVMNGRAYEADYIVGWPKAEIAVMGPDGVVNIAFRKQIEAVPEDQRTALVLAGVGTLNHHQVADILDVPPAKVKALVFQAREALQAAQRARETDCSEIREQLATLRGGALRRGNLRRHLRDCPGCQAFRDQISPRRPRLKVVAS